jgi:hypothetical protein
MACRTTETVVWRKTVDWCARIRHEVEGVTIRE